MIENVLGAVHVLATTVNVKRQPKGQTRDNGASPPAPCIQRCALGS